MIHLAVLLWLDGFAAISILEGEKRLLLGDICGMMILLHIRI